MITATSTGSISASGEKTDLELSRTAPDVLRVRLGGDWMMKSTLPGTGDVERELKEGTPLKRIEFDTTGLGSWNSGLVNFVLKCYELCRSRGIQFSDEALPPGLRKLIHLAVAVPEAEEAKRIVTKASAVAHLGERGIRIWLAGRDFLEFTGATAVALFKMFRGAAQFRWSDVLLTMQQCGPEALGVVALINFLVGVILAFVGTVQLRQFGATIYIADLVAIGTVREMGCLMTGVILCGRTGAAFAAELGAMKVNEEIAAFKTFGISSMEFLVLPRIIALFLMTPLLCVFADVIAIAGGYFVSIALLDVTSTEYLNRTLEAITLKSFLLGIFKGGAFGIIVAVFGCLRGMQSGTNAAAVGQATTSAVVSGITSIVAADGLFAVLCNALGI